jgi:hypothetical protein
MRGRARPLPPLPSPGGIKTCRFPKNSPSSTGTYAQTARSIFAARGLSTPAMMRAGFGCSPMAGRGLRGAPARATRAPPRAAYSRASAFPVLPAAPSPPDQGSGPPPSPPECCESASHRSAPRAFILSEPCARPTSGRLGASRRDDRDRPLALGTPSAPMRTAGALPTAPAGPIDTPTRPRYTRRPIRLCCCLVVMP